MSFVLAGIAVAGGVTKLVMASKAKKAREKEQERANAELAKMRSRYEKLDTSIYFLYYGVQNFPKTNALFESVDRTLFQLSYVQLSLSLYCFCKFDCCILRLVLHKYFS